MGNQQQPLATEEMKTLEGDFEFVPSSNILPTIYSRYKRVRTLGEGATCKVIQARDKIDHSQVAIKKLNRDTPSNRKVFRREYRILRKLVHPNVVAFRGTFIDKKSYCLVTELCTGGRLLDRVRSESFMSEAKVTTIVRQLLQAVRFMHQHNIIHRDLKPENAVYDRAGPNGHLVIIDFGCAREINNPNEIFKDFVGTLDFMAPECVKERRADIMKATDMWAIGVMTYLLLCGRLPFHGETRRELFISICQKDYDWPDDVEISRDARRFVRRLLRRNAELRMTADEALNHNWIQLSGPRTNRDLGRHVLKHVATYKSSPHLKKFLVDIAVSEMTEVDRRILSLAYQDISSANSVDEGFDVDTLRQFFVSNGMSEGTADFRAQSFFDRFGSDSGRITFDDFLRMHVADQIADDAVLQGFFERLDTDNDGLISPNDLTTTMNSLGRTPPANVVEAVIDECVTDWCQTEHHISFDEFKYAMKKLDSQPKQRTDDEMQEFLMDVQRSLGIDDSKTDA